jgi:phage terminase large subunit-like protein
MEAQASMNNPNDNSLASALAESIEFDWPSQARPEQLPPPGDWRTWLILSGRGWGKTRCGGEWVRSVMTGYTPLSRGLYRHMALIGQTAADARDTMLGDGKAPGEGSGLLQVCPKDFRPTYEPSKRRVTFPNGSICTLYNASEYDALRGPEHDGGWIDELAKFPYAQEVWDQYSFGLRRGKNPKTLITSTPRPSRLLKTIMSDPSTFVTRGRTIDNVKNLSASFIDSIMGRYAGTRLGRQELEGEVLEDTPGALWTAASIDAARIARSVMPGLKRIVVGVDPSVSNNENSDECGIIVAGIDGSGHAYVLEDCSGRMSPDEWARTAVRAYWRWHADRLVAETNQGALLVESTIRMVDPNVSFRAVFACKGKYVRAEPCSAVYEQGRVHHVGSFPILEDQMCGFTADLNRSSGSPDRVDSLVWCLTELMIEHNSFDHDMAVLTALYGNGQPPTGDALIDAGILKPKTDNGKRVRLRVPAGAGTTIYGGNTGRRYQTDADGIVEMTKEDADHLALRSWERVFADAR